MKQIVFFFATLVLASCERMGNKTTKVNTPISDSAVGFGFKCEWIAVKTTEQEKVAKVLGFKNFSKCNWKTGVDSAYEKGIFITPAIDGWTLVCGWGLSYSGIANIGNKKESFDTIKVFLKTLSDTFGETQFFCTQRIAEYHRWMKAKNGNIIRVYSVSGEIGENILIEGEPSDFEKNYKLANTFSEEAKDSNYLEKKDIIWPDEDFVMKVAENWSIDPTRLSERKDLFGKFGLIGNR